MSAHAAEIFELVLNGTPITKAWEHAQAKAWTITREEFDADLTDAYENLKSKGTPDRAVELGRAVERLHRLWAACMKIQDFKAALQVQREINALVGLRQKPGRNKNAAELMADKQAQAASLLDSDNGR
ncbi:MAG TPA: hypothetical protein PLJ47_00485 [Candidatus Hydrogenedentes bacterium]|nr:hypothetical protein [Candidatus Hydrogenedentota bacterium]